jgi:AraC family transcriptional activator of mtrCDE
MLTSERVTGNGSLDSLSGLAHLLRVRPEVRSEQHSGSTWATDHVADVEGVPFQIVTTGACAIDLVDLRRSVQLEAGDIAVLPHGSRYVVRAVGVEHKALECETQLMGGRFALEQASGNLVLAALPDLIVVRTAESDDAPRLSRLITAIRDELDADRAGACAIANDLASALFVMIVRIHVDREHDVAGLLDILGHRQAARAVEAMLGSPSRAWTLDELASYASASRASLVRMFQKTVRMAPVEFLVELRLSLARRRLSATTLSLAQIAAEIGYRSESSFSRAFRRRFGVTPGETRKSPSSVHSDRGGGGV